MCARCHEDNNIKTTVQMYLLNPDGGENVYFDDISPEMLS